MSDSIIHIENDPQVEMNPWQNLANAIGVQAVRDYRNSRTRLWQLRRKWASKGEMSEEEAESVKKQIFSYRKLFTDARAFIRSDAFYLYCGLDGVALLQRLGREKR